MIYFVFLSLVIVAGWLAASAIGSAAYFQGEQN